jgi:hypothetical protein
VANVVKNSIPSKCFAKNFEVLKFLFFHVIEIELLMTLYTLWPCCNEMHTIYFFRYKFLKFNRIVVFLQSSISVMMFGLGLCVKT